MCEWVAFRDAFAFRIEALCLALGGSPDTLSFTLGILAFSFAFSFAFAFAFALRVAFAFVSNVGWGRDEGTGCVVL